MKTVGSVQWAVGSEAQTEVGSVRWQWTAGGLRFRADCCALLTAHCPLFLAHCTPPTISGPLPAVSCQFSLV